MADIDARRSTCHGYHTSTLWRAWLRLWVALGSCRRGAAVQRVLRPGECADRLPEFSAA